MDIIYHLESWLSDNMPYEKIGNSEPVCIADEVPFDIPESWEWVRMSSVITLLSGADLTPDKYNDKGNGIPYITGASNIENENIIINRWTEVPKNVALKGNLLLTCKGTIGTMAILREERVHIARQIMAIEPVSNLHMEYLQIVLQTLVNDLKSVAKSMIPGISRDDVLNSFLPLPPLAEQRLIANKFAELLPLILAYEKKDFNLAKLNKSFPDFLRKSILQMAIQGKLDGQNHKDEPASVLLQRIKAEKNSLVKAGKLKKDKNESTIVRRDNSYYEKIGNEERCIDDEIPFDIPGSWEWCRLGSILTKLTDGTHSTPKYVSSGIPFISVKDVSSGKLDFSNCKYITEKEHMLLFERCNPEYGDVLLTKVGTTGIPVIVDTYNAFSLFVSVALLKFNQELVFNEFLICLLNSPLVQSQAAENTRGVGNKNWVMRDIYNTLIVLPPVEEQHRIVEKLKNIIPDLDLLKML